MLASLSDSTIKQYDVSLKLWWKFCSSNKIDPFSDSIPSVITFLSEQFDKGVSYGSLNTHRSALSLLLGNQIGTNDCVKRILKGAYRIRPSMPKYTSTWDPQVVLNEISNWYPNTNISLEKITKKLAILLAICTAHRVQTLSLIEISNINCNDMGIEITITKLIKTSGPGRDQPLLLLPYFHDNPKICPATTLKDYLSMTESHRTESMRNLFLTFRRPYRCATSQSISRWIKDVLAASGVDVTVFSAHSARHAATSAASAAGVSIDTIRKRAGWTSDSNIFARFYNRPLMISDNFARSICIPNQHYNST